MRKMVVEFDKQANKDIPKEINRDEVAHEIVAFLIERRVAIRDIAPIFALIMETVEYSLIDSECLIDAKIATEAKEKELSRQQEDMRIALLPSDERKQLMFASTSTTKH